MGAELGTKMKNRPLVREIERAPLGRWAWDRALGILSLGLYAPQAGWKRWVAERASLEGEALEYHGERGIGARIALWLYLIALLVALEFLPRIGFLMSGIAWLALPWLVVWQERIVAHAWGYRGVRLTFEGGIGGAFKAWVWLPLLAILSLGLALPYAIDAQQRYRARGYRYGALEGRYEAGVCEAWKLVGWLILGAILPWGGLMFSSLLLWSYVEGFEGRGAVVALAWCVVVALSLFPWLYGAFKALTWRLFCDSLALGKWRVRVRLTPAKLLWGVARDLWLTILSAGLGAPWLGARAMKERIASFSIEESRQEVSASAL